MPLSTLFKHGLAHARYCLSWNLEHGVLVQRGDEIRVAEPRA